MKKIITVLLAMIMLFSIVACANDTNTNKGPGNSGSEQQGKIWDKHELDFEGYEFVILGGGRNGVIHDWDADDCESDEITGNEVLDEVYNRNRLIETTYNCLITHVEASDLKNTIMSGTEEDGNLVSQHIKNTFALVEEGLLLDLNDSKFTYLNLDKPWYSQTVQRDTEIAGKLYFVNGDMLFTDEDAMWITLYNKELASRYITDANIYDLVKTNKWTVDAFMKYAALATTELVADDKMTYQDQWGYVGEGPNIAALITAAGFRYASITEDGNVVSDVFSADFQNAFKKCYETVDKRFCLLASDITGVDSTFSTMDATFYEGRALFQITGMNRVLAYREMDTDFGIIPNPKLTEEQENYYTWTTYNCNVVSVPYTCTNFERTSAIVEALFEESSYLLRPAYVDKALKYQSTRDDESIEMLDIIINSTVYDIGVVYDFGGIYSQLNNMVKARQMGSLSSQLKKSEPVVNKAIQDLIAKFNDN